MIPNQWYAILESQEVRGGKPVGITRMGEKLVVWRDAQGRLSCMSDLCPHRGVMLSTGKIKGECIECPFHGFQYDTSGRCRLVPANGKNAEPPKALRVRSYPAREGHGLIYIWWGEERPEYPPLPFFESIGDSMVYSTIRDHWPVHYSRAIENQLDVMHLPFVHRTTIGAGNRTLVNGPFSEETSSWPGDYLINLWISNERDEGQTPLKPSQMSKPKGRPLLQFRFPNIWQNWIADDLRIFIAFAPIDNENTMMYIRYYHNQRLPVLRQLYGWMGNAGNLIIERQDKKVVSTERPKRPDIDIGERLIQGDSPIILYRKRRRALIDQHNQSG